VGEYVAVVLMSATGGLLIAAAQDLLVIFVGLELLSLGLYILTAFAKSSGKSAEAALKYYLFGGMSAAFLLFGFSYLYGISGSTNLHRIMLAAYGWNAYHTSTLLYVALVMIAAGWASRLRRCRFICGRRILMKARPRPRGVHRIGVEAGQLCAADRNWHGGAACVR